MPNKIKLESVVTESFKLHCFETMTGMKFVVIADTSVSQQDAKSFLKQLYEAFADYILKDPFFVVSF
jgi:trafficking protein particle complex subunit 4